MKEAVFETIKKALGKLNVKLEDEKISSFIEIPKDYSKGDFAFTCFFLSGIMKMPPHEIAIQIRKAIGNAPLEFSDIETAGAYINFFLNRKSLAYQIIKKIGDGPTLHKEEEILLRKRQHWLVLIMPVFFSIIIAIVLAIYIKIPLI